MRIRRICLTLCAFIAVSCSDGPNVQPSPVIEDPVITCPADISVTAHAGQAPTVSFETPVALKGAPPVTVTCTPAPRTPFAVGTTNVRCEAVDSRAHKASCSFSVSVTPIPQLLKTRFMAFGDSLTEGKVTLVGRGIVVVPPNISNTSSSYVEQLNAKLVARYQDQTVTVVAEGLSGEDAGRAKLRLPDALSTYSPDALLLLDGANDLLDPTTFTPKGMQDAINSVVDALQNMVRQGKARGVRVFLATLPPMTAPRADNTIAAVPTLNARITALAATENVRLVDMYAAIPTTAVGSDGLHLKAQGYDLMAAEWLKAIIATMEAAISPSQ